MNPSENRETPSYPPVHFPGVNGWGRCVDVAPPPGIPVDVLPPPGTHLRQGDLPIGEVCAFDYQCLSGRCTKGVCTL